jgi:hypothetical protein
MEFTLLETQLCLIPVMFVQFSFYELWMLRSSERALGYRPARGFN